MATLNVRIEDDVRDALERKAQGAGLTLSTYVRDLLLEVVAPVRVEVAKKAPESLNSMDRRVLSLLHRILGRVLPENANDVDGDLEYQLERARVLEEGFTSEYGLEFYGIDEELSRLDSERVMDILDMFRITGQNIDRHASEGAPVRPETASRLRFVGFDFNDSLEAKMANYVEYLIKNDKWTEQESVVNGPTRGNSHHRVLDSYLRMLAEYRRLMNARPPTFSTERFNLTHQELDAIAAAIVHPSNRS